MWKETVKQYYSNQTKKANQLRRRHCDRKAWKYVSNRWALKNWSE